MTSSNYIKLFQIFVNHSYFNGGVCGGVKYKIDHASRDLLNQYNFQLVQTTSGFEFYSNTQNSIKEYLKYISDQFEISCFEFSIIPNDAGFYNITNFPVGKMGFYQFDSSFFDLNADGQKVLKSFFVDNSGWSEAAKIKVHFDEIIKAIESNQPLIYTVQFEARNSQWNYYIIPGSKAKLNNPKIEGDPMVEFNPPKMVNILNNDSAYLFSSGNTLISLEERPARRLILNDYAALPNQNGNSSRRKKIAVLPSANPNHFEIATIDNNKQMASPIYVYL